MNIFKRWFGSKPSTPVPPKAVLPILTLDLAEQRAIDYANEFFNQGDEPMLWMAAQRGYKAGAVWGYSYAVQRQTTGNT